MRHDGVHGTSSPRKYPEISWSPGDGRAGRGRHAGLECVISGHPYAPGDGQPVRPGSRASTPRLPKDCKTATSTLPGTTGRPWPCSAAPATGPVKPMCLTASAKPSSPRTAQPRLHPARQAVGLAIQISHRHEHARAHNGLARAITPSGTPPEHAATFRKPLTLCFTPTLITAGKNPLVRAGSGSAAGADR
jgi:hypothetical protein